MRLDGTTQPRRATSLKIGYLSAVEVPAHEGAQAVVLKARMIQKEAAPVDGQTLLKSVFSAALAERKLSQQIENMFDQQYPLRGALREAAEEIAKDDTIIDKQAALRGAVDEYINTLHMAMTGELVAKACGTEDKKPKASAKGEAQEAEMADEKTQAELAKYKALAELSDVQKAHYNTLPEAEQSVYLAMSADDRDAVAKAAGSNDEQFTTVEGATVVKSKVGAELYAVMKSQNEQIAKLRNDADMTRLQKQAETDLAHLPGTPLLKAQVLKSVEAMPQAARDALTAMLKAGDAACAPGFKPAAAQGGEEMSAADRLEKMADSYAAEHKVTKTAAYQAVLNTDEGRKLYKEAN